MGGLAPALDSRLEASFGGAGARIAVQAPLELRGPFIRDGGMRGYYLRNITAGIFSGDAYHVDVTAEAGSRVRIASSSATKVHTMPDRGSARSSANLTAEPGSTLIWGPHATILQAESNLTQQLCVAVQLGAVVYLAEVLVLGRLARGERCAFTSYKSALSISDGCETLYEERYVLTPGTTLDTSLAGQGAVVAVYALGAIDDECRNRLREVVASGRLVGMTALPNGAGLLVRGLAPSMTAGLALAEGALAAAIGG